MKRNRKRMLFSTILAIFLGSVIGFFSLSMLFQGDGEEKGTNNRPSLTILKPSQNGQNASMKNEKYFERADVVEHFLQGNQRKMKE
jgi:hypothetical protein